MARIGRDCLALLAACAVLAWLSWPALTDELPPAYVAGRSASKALTDWFEAVSSFSNSYFVWRLDPLLAGSAGLFGADSPRPDLLVWLHLALFFAGNGLLIRASNRDNGTAESALAALGASLLLLAAFGKDAVLLASVAWLPILIYLQLRILNSDLSRASAIWLIFLFVAIRCAKGANQLSLLVALASCFFCVLATPSDDETSLIRRRQLVAVQFLILLVPYLLVINERPDPEWFDYPAKAQLVPDDGLPGTLAPLTGWYPPVPVIDRAALRGGYLSFAAVGTLLSLIAATAAAVRPFAGRLFLLPGALFLCLLLDCALPENLAQIAPLASLMRLVPGLFPVPCHALVAGLGAFLLLLGCCTAKRAWVGAVCLAALGLVPAVAGPDTVLASMLAGAPADAPAAQRIRHQRSVASPSLYLVRRLGSGIFEAPERSAMRFSSMAPLGAIVSASHRGEPESLAQLSDHRRNTRWSPSLGRQNGDEWLHIALPVATEIDGIQLATGQFATDFPRKLRIRFAASCAHAPADRQAFAGYLEALPAGEWIGPVKFSPSGLPYFGSQSEVKVWFPRTLLAQCLLVEQLGRQEGFDWSVGELRLALPKAGSDASSDEEE